MNRRQRRADSAQARLSAQTVQSRPSASSPVDDGLRLLRQKRYAESAICFRQALRREPGSAQTHYHLGLCLAEQRHLEPAVASYREALALLPGYPEAHYNLGNALRDLGQIEAAAACFARAAELRPEFVAAHSNNGSVLRELGRHAESVACYRRALEIAPGMAALHFNLGNALGDLGEREAAALCYRQALDLEPHFPAAHHNLGRALLALGEMEAGFREYEWRWRIPPLSDRPAFGQPQWRGEPAAGQTLLMYAEQGFGDTLQFCRYAALAAERGLRVILEVPAPLIRLAQGLPEVEQVIACGAPRPAFHLHCPMLSMPGALQTTLATIPGEVPYLHPDPRRAETWRERLAMMPGSGPRVGLVWAGERRHAPELAAVDRRRSLAPERLAPLLAISGIRCFSLQKYGPPPPLDFALTDFMSEMQDFADTAALIVNLDLVIAVDTAVAHLAGALGKPVWLLDRFDHCWRWLAGRSDSPWYPTMRIYRQPALGDWDPAIAAVAADLAALAVRRPPAE